MANPINKEIGTWRHWHSESEPIRLGVSSCLLGEEVRFDGGHKRDRFLLDGLGPWVEWVSVCPEVDVGMGIPRPTVRLVDLGSGPRMVAPSTGQDYTEEMNRYAKKRTRELKNANLDGYVLKKSSPSCGMSRIKVYGKEQPLHHRGTGLFAAELLKQFPTLPIEEEGRLNDPALRESFVEAIFCHHRWRTAMGQRRSRGRLVEFHTAHKMLLRSHNEARYRRMGHLVGQAGTIPDAELFRRYKEDLFAALRTRATTKKHVNVLQHALGFLKKQLTPFEKQELHRAVEDYRNGLLPLVVPLTLIRFQAHKYDAEYLTAQIYLDPHPKELMIRNRV